MNRTTSPMTRRMLLLSDVDACVTHDCRATRAGGNSCGRSRNPGTGTGTSTTVACTTVYTVQL